MATHGEIRWPPVGSFDGRLRGDFHGRRHPRAAESERPATDDAAGRSQRLRRPGGECPRICVGMSELELHVYENHSPEEQQGRAGGSGVGGARVGAGGAVRRRGAKRARRATAGVPGMLLRSEVEVLYWGPDRGNPTSMRQGRGPEFTGRLAGGWFCWRASVRAGLKEAVDAWWWRTRVKRREGVLWRVSRPAAAMPCSCWCRGRIGDVIAAKSQRLTPGDLLGSGGSR